MIVQNGDPRKEVIALGQTYFAIFQNAGYMGLYGGLDVDDIHTRKQLEVGQKGQHQKKVFSKLKRNKWKDCVVRQKMGNLCWTNRLKDIYI